MVAALTGDASGFKPSRSGTHDHDASRSGCLRDDMRHGRLTRGCGIVDAQGLTRGVDAIEAVGGADARPDFGFATLKDFTDQVRVGDLRTGHAD